MNIYHSETKQQHGIPLHILQRQPVPTQEGRSVRDPLLMW